MSTFTEIKVSENNEFPCEAPVGSPVFLHGKLRVEGTYLLDQRGERVQLKGMSAYWLNWKGSFANAELLQWLRDDWAITLYRVAMGVEEEGGYLENPQGMASHVDRLVEACVRLGLYVIIDFHSHDGADAREAAASFFREMSERYGHLPNIIYELWNEPLEVSWNDVIRPYVQDITAVIREHDPDNLILAGTPRWSQRVDLAADYPLDDPQTLYVLHFYSGSHGQLVRDRADDALKKGLPLFVSEFGVSHSDGGQCDRAVYLEEADRWMQWMDQHQVSWANWSVCDKDEASSVLKPGASPNGGWPLAELSESGEYIRAQLRTSAGLTGES